LKVIQNRRSLGPFEGAGVLRVRFRLQRGFEHCGTGALSAVSVSKEGSLRVRCGALEITKTASTRATESRPSTPSSPSTTPGDLAPVAVRTGADGVVCADGLRFGVATVTETACPTATPPQAPRR
jgi:hypothetical protein